MYQNDILGLTNIDLPIFFHIVGLHDQRQGGFLPLYIFWMLVVV